MFIETAVGKGWFQSKADFLNHAVRHYKKMARAFHEAEDEYVLEECARIRKHIYGDGEKTKHAES